MSEQLPSLGPSQQPNTPGKLPNRPEQLPNVHEPPPNCHEEGGQSSGVAVTLSSATPLPGQASLNVGAR